MVSLLVGSSFGRCRASFRALQTSTVSYVNVDGTFRVLNSTDGVPVPLRPNQVAMSSLLINAINGQVNVSTNMAAVSTYVTPYNTFLSAA